jgi:hypothetical protein
LLNGHLCEFTLVFHFRIPVKQNDGIPAASLCQILPVTKNYTILPIESNDKLQPSHTSQNDFYSLAIGLMVKPLFAFTSDISFYILHIGNTSKNQLKNSKSSK